MSAVGHIQPSTKCNFSATSSSFKRMVSLLPILHKSITEVKSWETTKLIDVQFLGFVMKCDIPADLAWRFGECGWLELRSTWKHYLHTHILWIFDPLSCHLDFYSYTISCRAIVKFLILSVIINLFLSFTDKSGSKQARQNWEPSYMNQTCNRTWELPQLTWWKARPF